ncbi:MAG: hypothetical protein H6742_14780 [Alphaproteobacteria bacterium]|nr:hypothetical protein [Alphaproteobacteria bacterium]
MPVPAFLPLVLPLSLTLLACRAAPAPAEVRAAVLEGRLEGLAELPADGPLAPLQAEGARLKTLQTERDALERASRELMRQTIEDRIAAGQLREAAGPLASAVLAWPDDPAFLALAHQLGEAADGAEPDAAVLIWSALAEILAHQPDRAAAWQARADKAALGLRYRPDALATTRADQAGIRRAAVADLLATLDTRYVDALDHAAMAAAGARALTWLQRDPGALAAWPKLADVRRSEAAATDLAGLEAALDAELAALTAAGVPEEVVLDEWVRAALSALDPWTRAVWPAEIASWQAHHAGVRVGVGLELRDGPDGSVIVARPLPDTPAWASGIHQGDRLVALSDPTGRLALDDLPVDRRLAVAEQALVGAPEHPLTIDVRRGEDALSFTMARQSVVQPTVEGWARGADNAWSPWYDEGAGIAYARIDAFRSSTADAFDALLEPGLDHIAVVLLDLRGNPGGDVQAAVHIADRFVADGFLARIDGRVLPDTGPDVDPETGERLAEWNEAVAGHALEGTPVVVLVDPDTASAAEVLTAALQERAHAVVVGAPTWGKGWAQKLHTGDGYAMQYTNLAWASPAGRRLARPLGAGQRSGVVPDVAVDPASPGEQYVLKAERARRTALRVHADGTPMQPLTAPARADLPALDGDPTLAAAAAVARALLLPAGD